ncbi:MAG: glycosyltransferase family 4 protein [Salinivirgaceae bacterium]|nr:glycosyltransferase family 4 protein [Salinivirgaceae bacterium]MDD4747859.1 glycosyltransferase family 4 protein [Salinivirgaceae bacterium]MDY0280259.1 glycosyltransferase family 4 protein [Salinivirgaceae bacterium]
MKNAYIATYPPRQCGIGTFTNNLFNSMVATDIDEPNHKKSFIVAINDFEQELTYPEEVKFTIKQESQEDYLAAAKYINLSGADCCILQHEFGIFGGQDGIYILPLLHQLDIPLIVTLHTVIQVPSYAQKEILQRICRMANRIVVMSHKAIEMLMEIYDIPKEKIAYAEHGVPNFRYIQEEVKKEFKLEKKKVLLTFGFIGRNKGIETAIQALPKVVEKHPDVLYIVLGKTHPSVIRHAGEEYRLYLTQLIEDLNLEKNVVLLNEYTSQEELFKYLYASDIYITPYLNEAQITSGTLAYAVGAGSAVVSTPYWHATELLSKGRGVLFDFGNTDELSNILIDLLDHPEKRLAIRKKAFAYGRKITWPKIGSIYNDIVEKVFEENIKIEKKEVIPFDISLLPTFSIEHIKRLTDDTGIIQHAKFGIPNRKEGYCLDDNARALLMALMTYKIKKDTSALRLCPIYLSYIHFMQNQDGQFKNFLSYSRDFLDEVGSEDSFGRTIWALGYMLNNAPNASYYQIGRLMFDEAIPAFENLKSIRSIANTMIGVCYYLKGNMSDEIMIERLRNLTYVLVKHYQANSHDSWNWYEQLLAYDNAILPLAMLHATEILNDDEVRKVAFDSMNFLIAHTMNKGFLSIIGNEKWFKKEGDRSVFAQQPIDAMGMVLMFRQAYKITDDKQYLSKLFKSFKWFLGENDLRMSLFNHETQGCFDGLESYGINQNQGAESTLAYLISYLNVLKAHEDYYRKD